MPVILAYGTVQFILDICTHVIVESLNRLVKFMSYMQTDSSLIPYSYTYNYQVSKSHIIELRYYLVIFLIKVSNTFPSSNEQACYLKIIRYMIRISFFYFISSPPKIGCILTFTIPYPSCIASCINISPEWCNYFSVSIQWKWLYYIFYTITKTDSSISTNL